jgi:hypothetical protein
MDTIYVKDSDGKFRPQSIVEAKKAPAKKPAVKKAPVKKAE